MDDEKEQMPAVNEPIKIKPRLTRSGLPLFDGTKGKHFEGEYARKCALKAGRLSHERAKLRALLLGSVKETLTANDCAKIKELVENVIGRAASEGDAAALEKITKTFGLHFDNSPEAAGSEANPICTKSSAPVIKFEVADAGKDVQTK